MRPARGSGCPVLARASFRAASASRPSSPVSELSRRGRAVPVVGTGDAPDDDSSSLFSFSMDAERRATLLKVPSMFTSSFLMPPMDRSAFLTLRRPTSDVSSSVTRSPNHLKYRYTSQWSCSRSELNSTPVTFGPDPLVRPASAPAASPPPSPPASSPSPAPRTFPRSSPLAAPSATSRGISAESRQWWLQWGYPVTCPAALHSTYGYAWG